MDKIKVDFSYTIIELSRAKLSPSVVKNAARISKSSLENSLLIAIARVLDNITSSSLEKSDKHIKTPQFII